MADNYCPQCGALIRNGVTCEEAFHQMLALEFEDESFNDIHFLTVATYMIQHGQYSPAALVWIEERLREYLHDGVSTSRIRRQAVQHMDGKQRNWKVLRQPDEPPQDFIPWSITIQEVFQSYQDPPGYCRAVKHWAEVTLNEMQPLIKKDDER